MTVPTGYVRIPGELRCRCARLHIEPDGTTWCCRNSPMEVVLEQGLPAVTIEVPLTALSALMAAARECAEELAAEIDAKYPSRHEQPVQMRRHDRDMQVVQRVMDALGAIPKWTTP